jgi:hypothetical protein
VAGVGVVTAVPFMAAVDYVLGVLGVLSVLGVRGVRGVRGVLGVRVARPWIGSLVGHPMVFVGSHPSSELIARDPLLVRGDLSRRL